MTPEEMKALLVRIEEWREVQKLRKYLRLARIMSWTTDPIYQYINHPFNITTKATEMKNVRFLYLAKGNIPGHFPAQIEYMLKFKFNGTLEFHRIAKDDIWDSLTDNLDKAFHAFATAPTPDPKVILSHDLKKSARKTITGHVSYKWKDAKWNLETLEVKWGSKRLVFLDEATSLRFWLDIYLNLRSFVK